ncbi:hypothetical protein FQZ97_1029070 [compost metagenome]
MEPTGAVVKRFGAWAKDACPAIRASGVRPRFSASERRISSRDAAPSEIELALAAVTVPPSRNAGFRVGILSRRAFGGCSSWLTVTVSRPDLASTATISAAKRPSAMAFWARVREAMAKASCCSRVKP